MNILKIRTLSTIVAIIVGITEIVLNWGKIFPPEQSDIDACRIFNENAAQLSTALMSVEETGRTNPAINPLLETIHTNYQFYKGKIQNRTVLNAVASLNQEAWILRDQTLVSRDTVQSTASELTAACRSIN